MAVSERLKALLQEHKVRYTVAKHSVVYTAQEIAAAQHVPGRQLAKCVLVLADHGPVLAVLPAIELIDLAKLKRLLNTKKLSIGREADIKERFPDVEVGAMSPFGNLYGVPVVVDQALATVEEIVFNAGTHTETVKMRYADFARLVKPTVGAFGQPITPPAAAKKRAARKPANAKPAARRRPASRPKAHAKTRAKSRRR